MHELIRARLAPLANPDFRNFLIAQSLSMIGTWSHDLARAWIIISLTGSSGALGNLSLAIAVPCLFFILQAGVLVDNTDVRRLMQRTKSLLGISSLILAAVTEFSDLQVWHLILFGIVEGIIVSFDAPGFSALTVRMVSRADFQQAIALNSTNFHTSRMLGPIVAAWLMSVHGPSLVFFFDALSYFIVAFVIARVKLHKPPPAPPDLIAGKGLRDGLRYIYRNISIRYRVSQLMLTLCCVFPLMVAIFRVYVQQKYNLDAKAFGTIFTFPALGSMGGALSFAIVKPKKPIRALWFGVPLVFTTLMILPLVEALPTTVTLISLTGFGLYMTFASLSLSMHLDVDEPYRGRMSSVIGMGFTSIGPIMCFPWGHFADHFGAHISIWVAALLFGLLSATLAILHHRKLRR